MDDWHHLAIDVDFLRNQSTFYVDGTALGTWDFPATADVLLRGSLVTEALPDGGGNLRSDFTYRFDNFSISAVPEPAGLMLIDSALTLLMIFRRRGVQA